MMIRYLFNTVLLIGLINGLSAQTYYVNIGATGTGASWADASGDLTQILSEATAGAQVWVAQGTYYPVVCNSCTDADRNISFEIKDSVEVYGGFIGTESTLDQRDWESNATILSGDLGGDGLAVNNTRTIVHFTRVSAMTILDGFSIRNGYAHNPGGSMGEKENSGAAIYNQGALSGSLSNPNIRNCHFENNSALGYGGAVYNNGGFSGTANPIFENCIFSNNTSNLGGGAVFNYASFSGTVIPVFTNCDFQNNTSNQNGGGGVYNQAAENGDCSTTFVNCLFDGNATSDYGGGVHNHGRKGKSNASFQNCIFSNNEALFGGGVSNNGTSNGESNAVFTDCVFEDNHVTGDGAGLYNWGSDNGESNATLDDCIFRSNNSDFAGAGMFNNGINGECSAHITNCQFIDNVSITYGAAIYSNGKKGNASPSITNCLFQNNSGNSGGGVYSLGGENGNSSPIITNCTFFGNSANVGGAIYNNASDSTGTSSPIITNCIFWKNEANFGRVFRNVLGTPFIQYSVVDELDCNSMNSGIGSVVTCGTGVIYNVYPEFVDTLNRDFRLKSNSPLLNLGNNTAIDATGIDYDLDHQSRIVSGIVDFGAYEYFDDYVSPTITSQPASANLCEGGILSLNVLVEGTGPFTYQWLKNNIEINNEINSELIINAVETDDSGTYNCQITDAAGTILNSNMAEVLVNLVMMPAITFDVIDVTVCENQEIVFVSSFLNGGNDPAFSWYVNGNQIAADQSSVILDDLNDGDIVSVILNSSLACAQPSIATDSIQVVVSPTVNAMIEIMGPDTVICLGEEAFFTSAPTNGGDDPLFQWFLNGNEISGQNGEELITTDLLDGDIVTCLLTSSEECVIEGQVMAEEIQVQVDSCLATNVSSALSNNQVWISPNPSQGLFYLNAIGLKGEYSIILTDLTGKSRISQKINFSINNEAIQLNIHDPGIYFVKIFNHENFSIQKIFVDRQ